MKIISSIHQIFDFLKTNIKGHLSTDSRQIQTGDVFIAWPGAAVDGRQFVDQALAKGAALCIVEGHDIEQFHQSAWYHSEQVMALSELKKWTGTIAAQYYNHPTQKMSLLAVTGTNGKTSTAWWIASTLQQLQASYQENLRCAIAGTLGIGEPDQLVPNGLTTPDPVLLQKSLADLYRQGVRHCAIEASSIGLAENRLAGCEIKVALFTNLTQDHLDYHGSMENYWLAKQALFDWPGLQHAVINQDDPQGADLAKRLACSSAIDIWTVSCQQTARLQALNIHFHKGSVSFDIIEHSALPDAKPLEQYTLHCNIVGSYNVSNLLGVIAALRCLGLKLSSIVQACANLKPVPGRMEVLSKPNCPTVAIDYAHTPDALEKALLALRPSTQNNGGKLWCVFGCGGNRDATKRPLMAKIAQKLSDHVVLTSDNPRFEDPTKIIADAQAGFEAVSQQTIDIFVQRAQAIAWAVTQAKAQDVILIAGKGHEAYQEIEGVQYDFSDMKVAQSALEQRSVPCSL